ncbi:hypothetical protein P7C71_g3527, partial [Lecanoromycetidae sp. Uapishka_2]
TTTTAQGVDCAQGYTTQNGLPITSIDSYTEGTIPASASNAYECCEACVSEAGCAYSIFNDGTCNIALIGSGCNVDTVAGVFYTSNVGEPVGVINNGPCGYLTFAGNNDN